MNNNDIEARLTLYETRYSKYLCALCDNPFTVKIYTRTPYVRPSGNPGVEYGVCREHSKKPPYWHGV